MRTIIKRLLYPVLSRWYKRKTEKVQHYTRYGIQLSILPSVFHPGYFLSTNLLVEFLKTQPIPGKRLLELGAGSGLVAFYAAKQGAHVTATDINPQAIAGLQQNALKNQLPITVVQADLLEGLSLNDYDYIIINPPYYPKNPSDASEVAFYCGEDFGYFTRLFSQLAEQSLKASTQVFMILSEDCRISHIFSLAKLAGIGNETVREIKRRGERNFIYRLYKH